MRIPSRNPRAGLFWVGLVLLAAAAAALLVYVTPRGMGLVNDSVAYINGARGFLDGSGYGRVAGDGQVKPITHFPPVFSLLLAGIGLFGLDAIDAAWWANLFLFAGNILLAGLLARRLAQSDGAGLLAAALLGASESMLRVHTFALSEPLFLLITLLSLLCLERCFSSARWVWPAAAGLLAGLSYLTRYVGGALLAVELLGLLLFLPGLRRKLRAAGVYLAAALPLIGLWSLRNALLTGSATNRSLGWHPVAQSEALEGLRNFWAFLLPQRFALYERLPAAFWAVLAGLLVVLFLGAALWAVLRALKTPAAGQGPCVLAAVILLHALAYLVLVVFSMTTMDASTIFENRILAPLYLDLLLLASAAAAWLAAWRQPFSRAAVVILAGLLLLSFVDDSRRAVPELRQDGQGFAGSRWTNSDTMDRARRLPQRTIYTNRLSAVTLLADRQAFALLSPVDPVTQQPRPGYGEAQAAIQAAVMKGNAYLVVFSARQIFASEEGDWLEKLVNPLPVYAELPDGIIYGRPD